MDVLYVCLHEQSWKPSDWRLTWRKLSVFSRFSALVSRISFGCPSTPQPLNVSNYSEMKRWWLWLWVCRGWGAKSKGDFAFFPGLFQFEIAVFKCNLINAIACLRPVHYMHYYSESVCKYQNLSPSVPASSQLALHSREGSKLLGAAAVCLISPGGWWTSRD